MGAYVHASNAQLTYSAVWIRLPELPTEVYDFDILQRVGSKIGTLLKIDTCTSATTRGRYACICIEVPLESPVKSYVFIDNHRQQILYEGLSMLCTLCGRLGNNKNLCTYPHNPPIPSPSQTLSQIPHQETNTPLYHPQHTATPSTSHNPITNEWQTVSFPVRGKNSNPAKGKRASPPKPITPLQHNLQTRPVKQTWSHQLSYMEPTCMSFNEPLPSHSPSTHHFDTTTPGIFFTKEMLELLNDTTEEPSMAPSLDPQPK